MKIFLTLFTLAFLFNSCSESASVNFFDKNIADKEIECLRLVVFPPDESLEKSLEKLYGFSKSCNYKLEVSKKSGITCNSNFNVQKKATGSFPSSYLKMQLSRDRELLYSYYIDLKNDVSESDIEDAFSRITRDLKIN